jgi:protein required for attachment to host cells
MDKILLPADTWVLVGDGRKALVFRNAGDAEIPNLKTIDVFKQNRPSHTADIGTDKPGRTNPRTTTGHSAYEQADWHEIEELRFADRMAEVLTEREQAHAFKKLVIVAPPKTLAELRRALPDNVKRHIIAEVDKDLTKHPVYEIERLLTGKHK